MKKAKEYAQEINLHKGNEVLLIHAMSMAMSEMISEIGELMRVRNVKTRPALKSILLEQERKWKAICRLIEIEGMGSSFMECLKKAYPLIWEEAGMQ